MKKQTLLFFTFLIVSLFFISQVNAISDNDINFSWITSSLYDNDSIDDFDVDSSLNHVIYNNSDYYEHVNDFDAENYTNDLYLENISRLISLNQIGICNINNSYYVFQEDANDNVFIYDNNWNYVKNVSTSISNYFETVRGITTDNNYIYVLGQNYDFGVYFYHYVIILDINLNVISQIFDTYSQYLYNKIVFSNNSLYITYVEKPVIVSNILQLDLNGNIIQVIDMSAKLTYGNGFAFYQDKYYIDDYELVVKIFDFNFNLLDTISLSNVIDLYIFNDLIFYTDLTNDYMYVLNLDFISSSYYDIVDYYPDSNGLFDSVDNVNISLQEQTNPLGYYNATLNMNDINDFNTISEVGSTEVNIINEYKGHKDVLELVDNDAVNSATAWYYLSENEMFTMTVDFWILLDDSSKKSMLNFKYYGYGSSICDIGINGGYLSIYTTGIGYSNIISANSNQWYHFSVYLDQINSKAYITINNIFYGSYWTYNNSGIFDYCNRLVFTTHGSLNGYKAYYDSIGIYCNQTGNYNTYEIGSNLQYGVEYNGFWNEIEILNEDFTQIISIECLNGTYYINDTTTNFNVFFNFSQYVYNTWILNIEINQNLENGTLYVYNESNSLLFSQDFDTNCSGNIKYIKYIQYYQDSSHFIYLSNFSIESNSTKIAGKKGYISYGLDLIDTNVWNFEYSSSLTINAYGRYEIYVSNESYQDSSSLLYQISGFIDFRNEDRVFDLSYLNDIVINPYLIIVSMNGQYKLNSIKINGSSSNFILYDDRNNVYLGSLQTSNINTSQSYFYILNGRLNYKITFDDDDLEYMKLTFNIEDITNENYQFIHTSYFNSSNTNVLFQIKLKNNDATYDNIDMGNYYNSEISNLDQDKTTIQLEFLLSDNDLENNANFSGYFSVFSFGYNAQISISTFITTFMIMLLPIIIILSLTFGISHVLRKDKTEIVNKSLFFPIFVISSIIVFILGFFDAWILFIMIIATIAYVLNRKEELS